jgi:hypothetical protein
MINTQGLSLDQAPPISVPFRFFLTAPAFGVAAAAVLTAFGPEALSSRWSPALLAATHLFLLGFVASVMFGAVQQMLPVVAGSPVPQALGVSRVLHVTLSGSSAALGAAFLLDSPGLFRAAAVGLGATVLLFLGAAGLALWRAKARHATTHAMRLSLGSLLVAASFGVVLAVGHAGDAPLGRGRLTDLHLAWALAGWVGTLVIGVAFQVVPMFQMTPPYPDWARRSLANAVVGGLVIMTLGLGFAVDSAAASALGAAGMAVVLAAFGTFAALTLGLHLRRKRRRVDPSMSFWRLALASMALAVAAAGAAAVSGEPRLAVLFGTLAAVGVAGSLISGMLYKIAPFLVWFHLQGKLKVDAAARRTQVKIPHMGEAIPAPAMRLHVWVHAAAVVLIGGAALLPEPLARPAGVLVAASFAVLGRNLIHAVRVYGATLRRAGHESPTAARAVLPVGLV